VPCIPNGRDTSQSMAQVYWPRNNAALASGEQKWWAGGHTIHQNPRSPTALPIFTFALHHPPTARLGSATIRW
jgi:hypothetical protein